jgi:hypothetical protein
MCSRFTAMLAANNLDQAPATPATPVAPERRGTIAQVTSRPTGAQHQRELALVSQKGDE